MGDLLVEGEATGTPAGCTAQLIAELVERRSILRHWHRWWRPRKRRDAVGMAEAWDKLYFEGLELECPSWRLNETRFLELAGRLRIRKEPHSAGTPLPPVAPERRSELHEMFVRWSIRFGGHWVRMNVLYDRELLRDGDHPLQRSAASEVQLGRHPLRGTACQPRQATIVRSADL